ncbi:hypothetical protein AQUSIP_17090 [Aquicella siphonis]|uniref:Uncharacterized protein n=1 Tax=Aquicella siphonis TaxID=254247 RepID=A0A5E4PIY5_9COXI|nr:hypothetical protein AQUSIP_17090 [Aquicella siphonis]
MKRVNSVRQAWQMMNLNTLLRHRNHIHLTAVLEDVHFYY